MSGIRNIIFMFSFRYYLISPYFVSSKRKLITHSAVLGRTVRCQYCKSAPDTINQNTPSHAAPWVDCLHRDVTRLGIISITRTERDQTNYSNVEKFCPSGECLNHISVDRGLVVKGARDSFSVMVAVKETEAVGHLLYRVTWDEDVSPSIPAQGDFVNYFHVDNSSAKEWRVTVKESLVGLPDSPLLKVG